MKNKETLSHNFVSSGHICGVPAAAAVWKEKGAMPAGSCPLTTLTDGRAQAERFTPSQRKEG